MKKITQLITLYLVLATTTAYAGDKADGSENTGLQRMHTVPPAVRTPSAVPSLGTVPGSDSDDAPHSTRPTDTGGQLTRTNTNPAAPAPASAPAPAMARQNSAPSSR